MKKIDWCGNLYCDSGDVVDVKNYVKEDLNGVVIFNPVTKEWLFTLVDVFGRPVSVDGLTITNQII